jgi:hypothetical protein
MYSCLNHLSTTVNVRYLRIKIKSVLHRDDYVLPLKLRRIWLIHGYHKRIKIHVMPTECIHMFCSDLRKNCCYFLICDWL